MSKKPTTNKNFVSPFAFDSALPDPVSSRSTILDPPRVKRRVVSPGTQQRTAKKARKNGRTQGNGTSTTARGASRLQQVKDAICEMLAELEALGVPEPHRLFVCYLVGFSNLTSTNFAKAISELAQEGLIEYPAKKMTMRLSDSGRSKWHANRPSSNADAQRRLLTIAKKRSKGPSDKVDLLFELLKDGQVHSREDVMRVLKYSNPTSTGYVATLQALNSENLGLVRNVGKGALQLTDLAFPCNEDEEDEEDYDLDDDEEYEEDDDDDDDEDYEEIPIAAPSNSVAQVRGQPSRHVAVREMEPTPARTGSMVSAIGAVKTTGNVYERIFHALAICNAIGIVNPTRHLVAILAGYPTDNAGFKKALGEIKKHGIVAYPNKDTVTMSGIGKSTVLVQGYGRLGIGPADAIHPPRSNAEMQDLLLAVIRKVKGSPNKMAQVFAYLRDGKVHSRAEVAVAAGYDDETESGYKKVIGNLRTLKIVEYPDKSTIQMADIAFPFDESNTGEMNGAMDTDAESMPPPPPRAASINVAVKSEEDVPEGIERLIGLGITDDVEQRICNGMAQLRAVGIENPSLSLLALFAGFASEGDGTFSTGASNLKTKGMILVGNGTAQLSDFGDRSLPTVEPPSDNAEMQLYLVDLFQTVDIFPDKIDELFDFLKDGRVYSREEVAAAIGFSGTASGGFGTMFSALNEIGIIECPHTNLVQLGGIAFPNGRNGAA